jgi:hypothetical protein
MPIDQRLDERDLERRRARGNPKVTAYRRQYDCGRCGAVPGEQCRTPSGGVARTHSSRMSKIYAAYEKTRADRNAVRIARVDELLKRMKETD